MIDVLRGVYAHWDFRNCTFANAVRLWGTANRPFPADVLASA